MPPSCLSGSSEPEASEPPTILHPRLLKTGLLPYLRVNKKHLLASAGTASPPVLPALISLLHGTTPNPGANPLRWNATLSALSHGGFPSLALWAFSLMRKLGLPLCSYSLCSALAASRAERAVRMGRQIHAHTAKSGWVSAVFVGGALVSLYAKSGAIEDARYAFDEILLKNTQCANTLLMGYVEAKLWSDGVTLVRGMPGFGLTPDGFTMSTLLRLCAEVVAAGLGMQVHAHLIRRTTCLEEDVFVQSSLMEMYGKCGLVNGAQRVFNLAGNINMPGQRRDVVLWTSMLNAFSRNGRFTDVVDTFDGMLHAGVRPDEVAFLAVLAACSRTGDVARALEYFNFMSSKHQVLPCREHYACIIDLFCKAGQLEKAWELANEMVAEVEGDGGGTCVRIWGTLLSACREFGYVDMGKLAAERALGLAPSNVGIYMELSNMYARMGMWDEIEQLRELLSKRGLKKDVGFSRIELTR